MDAEEVSKVHRWLTYVPDPAGVLVAVSREDVEFVAAYLHTRIRQIWFPMTEWVLIVREHPAARAVFLHELRELEAYRLLGVGRPLQIKRPGPTYFKAHSWACWQEALYWEEWARTEGISIPATAFLDAHPIRSEDPKARGAGREVLEIEWRVALPAATNVELERARGFYARYEMTHAGRERWLRRSDSGP